MGTQVYWRSMDRSAWPRAAALRWSLPGAGTSLWDERRHLRGRADDTHSSLWHIRHLLRSLLPSGPLMGCLLVGQENLPLRRRDQIFMHSFWNVRKRVVSGGFPRRPSRSWGQFIHISFLGWSVFSGQQWAFHTRVATTLLAPIPHHRLCQEPLLWLPRQKRQEESSKPAARAIIHEKRNTHLICIQLQIATHCRGGLYIIK